ncbi:MAG: hypothetical protein R3F14_24805 [Polyangiaceae bacterium]
MRAQLLTDVDSCTVPWVDDNDGFRRKSIAITSLSTAKVVGYIYQHKNDGDGDHIRITTSGYQSSGA